MSRPSPPERAEVRAELAHSVAPVNILGAASSCSGTSGGPPGEKKAEERCPGGRDCSRQWPCHSVEDRLGPVSSGLPLSSKWSNNTHLIIHESRAWHTVDAQSVPNYFYPPSKAEAYTAAVTKQLVNKVLEDLVLISFPSAHGTG